MKEDRTNRVKDLFSMSTLTVDTMNNILSTRLAKLELKCGRMEAAGRGIKQNSTGSTGPCAACKLLRRRCTQHCIFAPYFPADEPLKFANVHKVFGASNVSKLLQEIAVQQRGDAVSSLVYEANARLRDPVYGCVGAISSLQCQIQALQAQLAVAQAQLVHLRVSHAAYLAHVGLSQCPAGTGNASSDSSSMSPSKYAQTTEPAATSARSSVVFALHQMVAMEQSNLAEPPIWSC